MSEIEDLKKEVKALKDQLNPPPREPWTQPRFDPTANFSMPRSALKAMVDCVPDALMNELRADSRRPNPVTEASSSSLKTSPAPQAQPQQRGTGWVNERPLEPPPGIKVIDAMMDAQDAKDKADLALRLARGAAMQSAERISGKED